MFRILIVKLRVSNVPFAEAVTEAATVPEEPSGGAKWMVPVRVFPTWEFEVTVMNPGPAEENVIAAPSGSDALTAWSMVDPGATTISWRTASVTALVPAVPSTPSASNQSPVAHRFPGSPSTYVFGNLFASQ
jgi:hypothetical protein